MFEGDEDTVQADHVSGMELAWVIFSQEDIFTPFQICSHPNLISWEYRKSSFSKRSPPLVYNRWLNVANTSCEEMMAARN
jgi:hypothetical protein